MNRKQFTDIIGEPTIAVTTASYLLSDKRNPIRAHIKPAGNSTKPPLRNRNETRKRGEKEVLFLASLA